MAETREIKQDNIIKKLVDIQTILGLNQTEFADMLGYSPASYSSWLSCKREVPIDVCNFAVGFRANKFKLQCPRCEGTGEVSIYLPMNIKDLEYSTEKEYQKDIENYIVKSSEYPSTMTQIGEKYGATRQAVSDKVQSIVKALKEILTSKKNS